MMKFYLASCAFLLLTLSGCSFDLDRDEKAHKDSSTSRSEYQRSETTHSDEGTSADVAPGTTRSESHTKKETKIIREQQE